MPRACPEPSGRTHRGTTLARHGRRRRHLRPRAAADELLRRARESRRRRGRRRRPGRERGRPEARAGARRRVARRETIDVAGLSFECVPVPGHSPAHVAFYTGDPEVDGCLFSGDLLFAGSVGRVDLPGADWETLLESVRRVAERFPPETVVYPGHGPATTLGEELARNPFLAELRA